MRRIRSAVIGVAALGAFMLPGSPPAIAAPTPIPAAAPRAGGIPPDLALGLLGGGAAALAGGLALLRRGRRAG